MLPNLGPFTGLKLTRQFDFSRPPSERTSGRRSSWSQPRREVKLKGLKGQAQAAIDEWREKGGWQGIVEFIEENVYDWTTVRVYRGVYDYSAARKIVLDQYQRDILNHVLTPWQCTCEPVTTISPDGGASVSVDESCENHRKGRVGRFKYSEVVWSQPKKHGKTQIAACVVAWFAAKVEAPNLIYTLASNQEQSAGLIFNSAVPTLYSLGGKVPTGNVVTEVRVPNGTLVKAIPNNYAGQAGGNYGLTAFSELWTWKSERDLRLWEELPPVPTRFNSIRWSETYAGFQDESTVLQAQFARIWGTTDEHGQQRPDFTERRTQPNARPVPELEHIRTDGRPSCWHIPEEGLFVFWDHEIRASWITDDYQRERKTSTRYSTWVRLWQNRWQTSEGTFLDHPDIYDACVTLDGEEWGPMVLAGDASQRNDMTALVGVQKRKVRLFGKEQERYRVMLVRAWDPQGRDMDLDETIARYVKAIHDQGLLVGPFRYDPFQMHQVAVNLKKMGVPCLEFNQGQERLKADSFLWKQFNQGTIDLYPSPTLEAHVKAANAKEYENEQVRIIKGEASSPRKVDAAVALSMAVWAASKKIPAPSGRKRRSVSVSLFDEQY